MKWAGAHARPPARSPRWSCCSCSPAIRRGSGATLARLEQVLPSALAGMIARIAEKFASGLGAIRRPGRLLVALAWSFPLWLSIALGIWAVAVAFRFAVPFTGSFLLIALLVIGVAVPTPGAVGGFHEAFRVGATMFFGAPDDAAVGAAIVLHAVHDRPVAAARPVLRGAGRAELSPACGSWPIRPSRAGRRNA